MTKLLHVTTPAENLYNESIIRTRNVVERQYGVWKRRFPILKLGMRLKMPTILTIIVATAVLHNIAIDANDDLPEDDLDVDENNDEDVKPQNQENHQTAIIARRQLIENYFNRL